MSGKLSKMHDFESTNICRKRATFLDLNICVNENQFFTDLYQIFRLCNVDTTFEGFIRYVKALKFKLLHQNFMADILNRYIEKLIDNKPRCTYKFWAILNLGHFVKNWLIV